MSIYLYEGQTVSWIGEGGHRARGNIISTDGAYSAHVKWASGPNAGDITLTDVYDLQPLTANYDEESDPMHLTAVRRNYDAEGESGVLNFLASHNYLDTWSRIAANALEYVEQEIRKDASMELVDEQLNPRERDKVVQAAAISLLRDAFGEVTE